jgi:hypothetical protein
MNNDVFEGYGIRIKLNERDDFSKIRESLTRIGIPSSDKVLWQSCHILHKSGNYAVMHFKELFELDGKGSSLSTEDVARRNRIAALLEEWGLCTIVDRDEIEGDDALVAHLGMIKVITYADKPNWDLRSKYVMRSERGGSK